MLQQSTNQNKSKSFEITCFNVMFNFFSFFLKHNFLFYFSLYYKIRCRSSDHKFLKCPFSKIYNVSIVPKQPPVNGLRCWDFSRYNAIKLKSSWHSIQIHQENVVQFCFVLPVSFMHMSFVLFYLFLLCTCLFPIFIAIKVLISNLISFVLMLLFLQILLLLFLAI